jgi:hypothetical protein
MVSCPTTQIKAISPEPDDPAERARELDMKLPAESFAEAGSGAYHTEYHDFGLNKVPLVVSIPNTTDQEIDAIICLYDDRTVASASFAGSGVFDFEGYPAVYKEKYIIAALPYTFESGDVRVKNIKNSVGDIVDFVKVIAGEYQFDLNRIILAGYTTGFFSMAYL